MISCHMKLRLILALLNISDQLWSIPLWLSVWCSRSKVDAKMWWPLPKILGTKYQTWLNNYFHQFATYKQDRQGWDKIRTSDSSAGPIVQNVLYDFALHDWRGWKPYNCTWYPFLCTHYIPSCKKRIHFKCLSSTNCGYSSTWHDALFDFHHFALKSETRGLNICCLCF